MTWTYTKNPLNNKTDAVRLLIGDVDDCNPLLEDEEIAYFLGQWCDPLIAATEAVIAQAARYSRLADETVGKVSVTNSQKAKGFLALAQALKARTAVRGAAPITGGISKSDKDLDRDNSDLVQPNFTREIQDNRRRIEEFNGSQDQDSE